MSYRVIIPEMDEVAAEQWLRSNGLPVQRQSMNDDYFERSRNTIQYFFEKAADATAFAQLFARQKGKYSEVHQVAA